MGAIIITAVLLLLAAVAFFAVPHVVFDRGTSYEARPPRWARWAAAAVPLAIALVVMALACTTVVQAKQEGVLLTFGRPAERTLSPGLNVKAPWQKVVAVDTTKQVDNFNDGSKDTDHHVIKVLLGNGNKAGAYASVTWGVKEGQANRAYSEYRGDDPIETIYERVIAPNFKASLQEVGGLYNPVESILAVLGKQKAGQADVQDLGTIKIAPDLDALTDAVRKNFEDRVEGFDVVTVYNVNVSFIEFDDRTQATIDGFQQEVAKTVNALQGVQTAEQIADQNQLLAASVKKDPEALAAQCFKMISEGKFDPPIGFSCYPPSGGGSGQTPVIVQAR